MRISVYVDGSGGSSSGYGYFVKETGESFYEKNQKLLIIRLSTWQ
jgi:ribonuclease HI